MKWHEFEIKKVANVVSGYGFPREYQGTIDEEIPFFKVGDMNLPGNERCMITTVNTISKSTLKILKAKPFPKGTIIFPKIGAAIATNKKRMLVKPSVADNNIMGLIPSPHINEWYLYYWMQQFDLRSVTNIGPVPSMRKTEVEKILIPLPPLSEQRRIVEILDQADALRKKRVEANAKVEHILPALFYMMFGDPATNSKGWKKNSLGDVIFETQYGTSVRADAEANGIAVIRMNNIDSKGYLDLTDLKYAPLSMEDQQHYGLEPGDLLFNRTNSKELVGKTGLWQGQLKAVAASYLIKFRVNLAQVCPEFIWAYMNSSYIKQMLFNKCRHAIGMANINAKELRSLPLIVPPLPLQKAFVSRLTRTNTLINQDTSVQNSLEQLFSVLIHRAFTSELTAKWREAHMRELLKEMEFQAKHLEKVS